MAVNVNHGKKELVKNGSHIYDTHRKTTDRPFVYWMRNRYEHRAEICRQDRRDGRKTNNLRSVATRKTA